MAANSTTPAAPAPAANGGDWRATLTAETRQKVVNIIFEISRRALPFTCEEGLHALMRVALIFELKMYTVAADRAEYRRKIERKMFGVDSDAGNCLADVWPADSADNAAGEPATSSVTP